MNSKEFLDKDVVGSDGWKIGKSKEIIVDPATWHVSQIEIELNEKIEDELGEKMPFRHNRVPIDINYVQGIGDIITLKAKKDEILTIMSAYSRTHQPEEVQKGPIVV
ncbi:MAG TPA: PRC-barrel domain-containing protein [Nitrososphaerales archaeon]|nr:PRC-barrel domain-containing protein [Nitrososphaerales archaeon]